MNASELAALLNGREYREEITKEECEAAKQSGLVVVYGASDDLMEFSGAINDETDCYDGGTAHLDAKGLLERKCEDEDCPYEAERAKNAVIIEAIFCEGDHNHASGISWTYKTAIPHVTFDIMEDDEIYCRGIVFSMEDLAATFNAPRR